MQAPEFPDEPHHYPPSTVAPIAAGDWRVICVFAGAEEVGQPYDVRLVSFGEMKEPAYRALQPFGQIPTYQEGDLVLFESGAIVLHIAERHTGLLPDDVNARARAITWMFAALNTVEPPIVDRSTVILVERDKPWYDERLPVVESRIRDRLGELSSRLGESDWLEGRFTAGDLLMVSVIRRLGGSGILDEYPNLAAYVARGEARPASSVLSRLNWRFSGAHRAVDGLEPRVALVSSRLQSQVFSTMKKIDVSVVPAQAGSTYPHPFEDACEAQSCRRLARHAGLAQFGVNLTVIERGLGPVSVIGTAMRTSSSGYSMAS